MENNENEKQSKLPGKKELKKQLANKMKAALPELRSMLGEKKFMHRLKKAAKLLIEGLHKEDLSTKQQQPAKKVTAAKKTATKTAAEKPAEKSTAVKKTAAIKTAAKIAKASPANKAETAK